MYTASESAFLCLLIEPSSKSKAWWRLERVDGGVCLEGSGKEVFWLMRWWWWRVPVCSSGVVAEQQNKQIWILTARIIRIIQKENATYIVVCLLHLVLLLFFALCHPHSNSTVYSIIHCALFGLSLNLLVWMFWFISTVNFYSRGLFTITRRNKYSMSKLSSPTTVLSSTLESPSQRHHGWGPGPLGKD